MEAHAPFQDLEVGLKVEAHAPFQDLNGSFLLEAPPLLWAWQQGEQKCKAWFHKVVRQWQDDLQRLQRVQQVQVQMQQVWLVLRSGQHS